jgi:hypothetical protein
MLLVQSCDLLLAGKQELSDRHIVVEMIADYLDAVMWFYKVGLLPEHSGNYGSRKLLHLIKFLEILSRELH